LDRHDEGHEQNPPEILQKRVLSKQFQLLLQIEERSAMGREKFTQIRLGAERRISRVHLR
jgi:hypothetical protein